MCFIKNKGSIRHVHPNATILAFWNVNHPQGLSRIKNSSHNKQKPLITSVHHQARAWGRAARAVARPGPQF